MRNFLRFMAAAMVMMTAVACNDEGGNEGNGTVGLPPYTIEVDKSVIEADGIDMANFRVLDANGNDLCKSEDAKKVYIQNETEGVALGRRVYGFSSIVNGTFEFTATFKGQPTENSVTVTAQNRVKYEKYKQMICVYDLTGTWCTACPYMVETFEKVKKGIWGDQIIILAVHAAASATDPFAIPQGSTDLGGLMLSQFGGSGYPTVIYDLNDVVSATHSEAEVVENVRKQIVDNPSTCGVKISKATLSGGSLSIEAAMTSDKDGEYDLGYALLADGLEYEGGTEEDGIYDDVVAAVSQNFFRMQKDSKFVAKAGEEVSKSWTIEGLGNANPKKLRVVVYALREVDGRTIVDNANVCAVGSSANYMYNE